MRCIHLRFRTENYKKYCYCKQLKSKVELSFCKECEDKDYKKIKSTKCKKHNRTKATSIQKCVKEAVWYRDNKSCIFCHKLVPPFYANAHFISRSAGGKGIEENIFTACDFCHTEQDNGLNTEKYDVEAELYLKSKYHNWNKEKLIYKKYERKEKE